MHPCGANTICIIIGPIYIYPYYCSKRLEKARWGVKETRWGVKKTRSGGQKKTRVGGQKNRVVKKTGAPLFAQVPRYQVPKHILWLH